MLSYFTETYVFRLQGGICVFSNLLFLAIIVFSRTIQFMFNLMSFEISRCCSPGIYFYFFLLHLQLKYLEFFL